MAVMGVVKNFDTWNFQQSYVERIMDNAAYTAAHPDDTLVLAGPSRRGGFKDGGAKSLLAIGMLQAAQFTQSKPTQPMMAIGSGRSFYVSGKAQTQWSFGRLFVNGRNLLRVLYHNAVKGGIDVSQFDDPASAPSGNKQFFINLDSELFLVPFGLGSVFRDKTHGYCGGFYAELCMITSYAIGWNAGQNLILENVTGLSDRLLPYGWDSPEGIHPNNPGTSSDVITRSIDAVLGFIDSRDNDILTEDIGDAAPQETNAP